MYQLQDFKVGDRVQLAPHLDLWMMGARFGRVVKVGRQKVHVRLDWLPSHIVALRPDSIGGIVL